VAYLQAVMLLCEKQHSELIREIMEEIQRKQEMPQSTDYLELAASRPA